MFVKSISVCRGSGNVLSCRENLSAGFADVRQHPLNLDLFVELLKFRWYESEPFPIQPDQNVKAQHDHILSDLVKSWKLNEIFSLIFFRK